MSIGAGTGSAGFTPAGLDAVVAGVHRKQPIIPAMRYEGSTKDWELDQNNNFVGVTPNEQAVILSMCIRQGSIKSSPTTGNTLHEIEYLTSGDIGADVTNRVMRSNPIARLVASESISINRIEYQEGKLGLKVAVFFSDLEVDPNKIIPVYWRQ